jgi:XapX domain-containing protein
MFRTPALILGLLYLGFFSYLAVSGSRLPERVATHFGLEGQPDGWMDRTAHLRCMAVFGLAFPLFVPAICYGLRFLPDRFFNLPHRDYWLAPQRRPETMAYLYRHSLWFASLALGFVIGIHYSVIKANSLMPPHLPAPLILGVAGGFLAGTAVWVVKMLSHFRRVA